jgi:tRNA A-37 threonylcarbamoyl transferase component Bud32
MRAINVETVIGYLNERGLEAGAESRATALVGGVSGTVLLVESDRRRIVVKQALDQLLVDAPWFAKPERALTEAAALSTLRAVTPRFTPELLDSDPSECAMVMSAAPVDWRTWKTFLLDEDVDDKTAPATGAMMGSVLGAWHRATLGDDAVADRFDDYEAFRQLRLDPFHETVRGRHPDLSTAIGACVSDLLERRECLVHGDFTPKNVLVDPADPQRLWVLDFEVAHYGAAVFDLAFLHCHLLLKAVHRPPYAEILGRTAAAFQEGYAAQADPDFPQLGSNRLGWHTACLLLARVDGLSPAGYLSQANREVVRDLARTVLSAPDRPIADMWAMVKESNHR